MFSYSKQSIKTIMNTEKKSAYDTAEGWASRWSAFGDFARAKASAPAITKPENIITISPPFIARKNARKVSSLLR